MVNLRKVLFIVPLLIPFVLHSQEQPKDDKLFNLKDSKGRKQGYWKKIENGAPRYEGVFKDDNPVGQFKYFYPDGKVKAITYFSEGGAKGRSIMYHPNENIMAKGNYLGEQRDSIWIYFNEDEKKISEISYNKGKREGLSRTFFPGGSPDEDITYKNEVKEGPWIQYFPDGSVKLKATYEKGLLQGLMTVYYSGGKVMISGHYKNSFKEGQWYYFDEMGKTQKTEQWSGGLKLNEEYLDKRLMEEVKKLDSIK